MTEKLDAYSGETIGRGTMPEEQWRHISALAIRRGGEIILPQEQEYEPGATVDIKDFYDLATERYGKPYQGARAYGRVVKVAQDQDNNVGLSAELPKLVFRVQPVVEESQKYWRRDKERYQQLELQTLSNYVDAVKAMEAKCRTESQRARLYDGLGSGIGYGTVSFWREIVARHAVGMQTH